MGQRETIFELLKEYEEYHNRPIPISYDLLKLSDEHRKFDALVRRYWDNLHPLSRDVFTSFASEIQYLLHLIEENDDKLNQNNEELRRMKGGFEEQLEKFESEYDNRVTEGIATVSNRNFNLMDRENRVLKEKMASNEAMLANKDELIENLRYEISLLIDDSKEQEETAKLLEENISESITQFNSFTQQLDVFEDVMDTLQNANLVAEKEIDNLSEELDFKSELIDEVKDTYQKSLELSEQRYEALKEKVKEISPQIEEIHKRSKSVNLKNKELLFENEKLKKNLENYGGFDTLQNDLEDQVNLLKEKNNALEDKIDHLTAEMEMTKIKQSSRDEIPDEYKSVVYENKSDTTNIPVPKKYEYHLNPGQVRQPRIVEPKKEPANLEEKTIPKIKPIPDRKESTIEIAKPVSLTDQTKESQIPSDDEEEEDMKQIIKDVLMGNPPSSVAPIPSPPKIDNDEENSEKPKKSKKSSTKEKLLS